MEATSHLLLSTHGSRQLTAEEAIAEAAEEGLTLVQANHPSGFRHVTYHKQSNKFVAKLDHGGERCYLGSFHTPVEAALCVARWLREHASAEDSMIVAAAEAAAQPVESGVKSPRRHIPAVHPGLPGGAWRPHTARSAALTSWWSHATPASPPQPVLNMTVLAL
jgi:hypothetical protein